MKLLDIPFTKKHIDHHLCVGKATPAAQALLLSNLVNETKVTLPLLVITSTMIKAEQLQRNLHLFSSGKLNVEIFPDWETLAYDTFSPHQDITSKRLELLYHSAQFKGILIVPVTTLLYRLPPCDYVRHNCVMLKKGAHFDIETQRNQLTEAGYLNVDTVYSHGEFAIRGSLIDIYPMGTTLPIRIELFDDTIESLRTFSPETQRTAEVVEIINILPAREYPLTNASRKLFKSNFQQAFDVDHRQCPIYKDISKGLTTAGAEYYLPLFFERTQTLFDYLPQSTHLITTDAVHETATNFWKGTTARFENYRVDPQRPLLPPKAIMQTVEQLFQRIKSYTQTLLTETELPVKSGITNMSVTPLPDLTFNVKSSNPYESLTDFITPEKRILFVAETAGRREQLMISLNEAGLSPITVNSWADFIQNTDLPVAITVAPVEDPLWCEEDNIAVITESQLFGSQVMQRRRRGKKTQQNDQIIRNLNELKVGSPIVHLQHGVGRYAGLQTIHLDGQSQEFLVLKYMHDTKLYVPVAHLHLIASYTGVSDAAAPLHKLGNDQWSKICKKAAAKAYDVAAELLDIYAKRKKVQGEAFTWSEADYRTFANEFPFEVTPDQQSAIEVVLEDMSKEQPMDRLICGDVGFGKTEVAMRAAFAAVSHQKQVAILAPTTLLAQQHFETFSDRFADWPIKVEVLSRFKTAKQTSIIKDELIKGNIDIIIGTHKLLNEIVKFKDLGLLIVDEEHRFGVRQKEKMKSLRAQLNILTLTATPIPRTLNMAMSSIRDLSIISTPPAKRLSIKTFIHKHSKPLIKEAISRELLRGGQVYYLHNDVKTIERAAADIQTLIPEARIAVGHGQMRERELESVMRDFYHKHTNVLVCTTIIETGIDIPNANTIIIHRADKFGLAQLHQLRGRVGRSHHQAYAYLLIPDEQAITADAEKRLNVIESTTELGSGFILATHDLEIRGVGELLGEEQSGQISNIGFSVYMDMLEKAVKSLEKGETPQTDQSFTGEAEINLHLPALIPASYIDSPHTRLVLYKRIASCDNNEALKELQVEITDRFGLLPEEVKSLFRITTMKLKANVLGIEKIEANTTRGKLTFSSKTQINPDKIITMIQSQPDVYQLDGSTVLRYCVDMGKPEQRFLYVEKLLNQLAG